MNSIRFLFFVVLCMGTALVTIAQPSSSIDMHEEITQQANDIFEQVVEWRRHFHENPELSNREDRTAAYIADYLRSLGMQVQTDIAHTGVVGVLKGGKPGPVVGLRADIDALPVTERTDVPFKSTKTTTYLGREVGVMHACGHDTHIAMLMGAAKILTDMKEQLPGTIKFIFQPAEEGAPPGEEGGAKMMVEEGVLKNPDVDVIFGQHINSKTPVGTIRYTPKGAMAAADRFVITVKGKQTHGSTPWTGVDPIVTSAQIIEGLQMIVSRKTELTKAAAVISVGKIQGGVRNNIIPEEVEMIGTIRTLDTKMQEKIHEDIRHVATTIGESMGAEVEVDIQKGVPVTYNDPELTAEMVPSLERIAGENHVVLSNAITGAEDFSFFQKEVPGFYFFTGGMPKDMKPSEAAPHHTPDFYIEEEGMRLGVKALTTLAVDYMMEHSK